MYFLNDLKSHVQEIILNNVDLEREIEKALKNVIVKKNADNTIDITYPDLNHTSTIKILVMFYKDI